MDGCFGLHGSLLSDSHKVRLTVWPRFKRVADGGRTLPVVSPLYRLLSRRFPEKFRIGETRLNGRHIARRHLL